MSSKTEYRHADKCRQQGLKMLTAIVAQETVEIRGNHYDAIILNDDNPLVAIVYHGHNLQQKPVLNIYTIEEIKSWHRLLLGAEDRELSGLLRNVLTACLTPVTTV